MMPTIGLKLDQGEAIKLMDQYFDRINKLQKIKDIPQHIRFLLQDLVELRMNKWIPRQTQLDNAPKTMKELRRGTEFEEFNDNTNLMIQQQHYPYGIPQQFKQMVTNGKDSGFGSFYQNSHNYQQKQYLASYQQHQTDIYNNYYNQVSNIFFQQQKQQIHKNIPLTTTTTEPLTKVLSTSSIISNQSTNQINNEESLKNNQREHLNSSSSSSSSCSSSNTSFKNNKIKLHKKETIIKTPQNQQQISDSDSLNNSFDSQKNPTPPPIVNNKEPLLPPPIIQKHALPLNMMHNNYPYPPMMHIRGSMPPPPPYPYMYPPFNMIPRKYFSKYEL
jgi:hypothetical protein